MSWWHECASWAPGRLPLLLLWPARLSSRLLVQLLLAVRLPPRQRWSQLRCCLQAA